MKPILLILTIILLGCSIRYHGMTMKRDYAPADTVMVKHRTDLYVTGKEGYTEPIKPFKECGTLILANISTYKGQYDSAVNAAMNTKDTMHDTLRLIKRSSGCVSNTSLHDSLCVKLREQGILHKYINEENNPLYILDGKRMGNTFPKSLNLRSIDNIEVVVDTKARNKYGEEGKNGAVIITTKKYKKKLRKSYIGKFICMIGRDPIDNGCLPFSTNQYDELTYGGWINSGQGAQMMISPDTCIILKFMNNSRFQAHVDNVAFTDKASGEWVSKDNDIIIKYGLHSEWYISKLKGLKFVDKDHIKSDSVIFDKWMIPVIAH